VWLVWGGGGGEFEENFNSIQCVPNVHLLSD